MQRKAIYLELANSLLDEYKQLGGVVRWKMASIIADIEKCTSISFTKIEENLLALKQLVDFQGIKQGTLEACQEYYLSVKHSVKNEHVEAFNANMEKLRCCTAREEFNQIYQSLAELKEVMNKERFELYKRSAFKQYSQFLETVKDEGKVDENYIVDYNSWLSTLMHCNNIESLQLINQHLTELYHLAKESQASQKTPITYNMTLDKPRTQVAIHNDNSEIVLSESSPRQNDRHQGRRKKSSFAIQPERNRSYLVAKQVSKIAVEDDTLMNAGEKENFEGSGRYRRKTPFHN